MERFSKWCLFFVGRIIAGFVGIMRPRGRKTGVRRVVGAENSVVSMVQRLAVNRSVRMNLFCWATQTGWILELFALIEQVFFRSLAGLLAENLALGHRLSVLERVTKRPRPQGLSRVLPAVALTDRPGLAALARDGQG